jgi:hypothetical protein
MQQISAEFAYDGCQHTIDLESVLDRVRSIDDFQIANSWSSVA